MNLLNPDVTNFVIVPKLENSFGSLFEIDCLPNEILISVATINEIEIIDGITGIELKTGNVV